MPLINEYTIQTKSGVYDTLTSMPYFNRYVPQAKTVKSELYYSMWTRTTLNYTTDCDKSISDAYDVLHDMMDVTDDNKNYNRAVWIAAAALGGAQLIYMIINTILFCSPQCRRSLCCKVHAIIYEGIFLAMGIGILSLTSINFGR